jgi:hypothetical protein
VPLSVWIGKEGAQQSGMRQMEKLGTHTKKQLPDKDISTYFTHTAYIMTCGGSTQMPYGLSKHMIRQKQIVMYPKKEK